MTKMEYIRSCDKQKLAEVLCAIVNHVNDPKPKTYICADCPASKLCYEHHTGFIDWLEKEWKGIGEEWGKDDEMDE